jgi:hypothetical protein
LRALRNGEVARHNGLGAAHLVFRGLGLDRLEAVRRNSAPPPRLTKVPLIKGGVGIRYLTNHKTQPIRLSGVSGALLHFKYLADFHQRVVAEVARGQHFDGSTEYARYARVLADDPLASLFDPKASQAWESTDALVRLGLLRTTPAWGRATERQTSGGASAPTGRRPAPAFA